MGRKAPHTSHSTQHRHRRAHAPRLRARRRRLRRLGWDYPGSTLLEVRILRSEGGFARDAEGGAGQVVVYDDVTGSFRDTGLRNGTRYCYTVFARELGAADDRRWSRRGRRGRRRVGALERAPAPAAGAECRRDGAVRRSLSRHLGARAARLRPQDDARRAGARRARALARRSPRLRRARQPPRRPRPIPTPPT